MRITSNMYYKNIYADNNSLLTNNLFDVNKQIASGLKIQYAKDDVRTFTDTMRLDNEIVVLGQIKSSTESGYKLSNQSDSVLNEFETSLNRTRTLLLQAANGTNDDTSLDAIAQELRGIEDNFKNLANTSINGQYIFSGSAVDVKPISDDGEYMGNNISMNAFTGSNTSQQYNITGQELFLGENYLTQRSITSNVVQVSNIGTTLDGSTTMADYNGVLPGANQHHFYLRGTQSNGTAFKTDIKLDNSATIDDLLNAVGVAYGNTGSIDVVNVSMNINGEITIEDKLKGSSNLDFHMVGASDFKAADDLNPDIANIDILNGETTDYATASAVGTEDIFVREFMKSSLTSASGVANLEGAIYDRTQFTQDGPKLSSNVPQIMKDTNAFATPSTKISEVADLSLGTAGTLDGTVFNLDGVDTTGAAYSAQINFLSAGSTFTIGANTYDIFDMGTPRAAVDADEMTYQQLMDVVNMTVTANLPTPAPGGTDAQYDQAIKDSNFDGVTYLSYDGKIQFEDIGASTTQAQISIYDSNSNDFSADASVMTFNTNNALTITDPKTDFFKTLNDIITSLEDHKLYPDSSSGDARNVGISHSISMIDNLQDHVARSHSQVGAQSNALTRSMERTQLLEISSYELRSSVIDTDLAEASLRLAQLNINYEAMLSTVGKVSQLSLVNYL